MIHYDVVTTVVTHRDQPVPCNNTNPISSGFDSIDQKRIVFCETPKGAAPNTSECDVTKVCSAEFDPDCYNARCVPYGVDICEEKARSGQCGQSFSGAPGCPVDPGVVFKATYAKETTCSRTQSELDEAQRGQLGADRKRT